jgi:hypothetical protein
MKLTGLNVPSALANNFKGLVGTGAPNKAGFHIIRNSKKKRRTTNKKPKRQQIQTYESAVDFLIAYLTKKNKTAPPEGFRAKQIANIKTGDFDPLYWVKCAQDSKQVFYNVPSSAPFTGQRAYAYPDPANLPSIATYGNGKTASGALVYHGATVGGTFKDLGLTWQRIIFSLENKIRRKNAEPIFLKLSGSINGTANNRATRALLSVVIKRWIVAKNSARLTTKEPPTVEAIQALYRYVTPRGVAPFFNLTHQLHLIYNLRGMKYEEHTSDLTKCIVLIAPMPLMGYRNNNNTAASSTLTATVEVWQIKKGL